MIVDRRNHGYPWAHSNHSRGRAGHYIDPRHWTIATEAVLYHDEA